MKLLLLLCVGLSACLAETETDFGVKYLLKYQYVRPTLTGHYDVSTAVREFQQKFDLPVTGEFDGPTLEVMHKPRCGVADRYPNRAKRYSTYGEWRNVQLTYSFYNHGDDLDQQTVRAVIRRAFGYWEQVSSLRFSETNDPNSDLKIVFGHGHHYSCNYPFDGPSGTLAHAFYPEDGRIHFDEAEHFTDQTSEGINLLAVAVHEIGHAIGLQHSYVHGSIMYPTYNGYEENLQLHQDDISGIQSLYPPTGPQPSSQPTAAPTPAPPTQPPNPDCVDRLDNCHVYTEANYCSLYPDNMKYWCTKSCYFC